MPQQLQHSDLFLTPQFDLMRISILRVGTNPVGAYCTVQYNLPRLCHLCHCMSVCISKMVSSVFGTADADAREEQMVWLARLRRDETNIRKCIVRARIRNHQTIKFRRKVRESG